MNEPLTNSLPLPSTSILSPLRYPGGKRRLVGYITEALRINALQPQLFVEPFAGGASVSLQLLSDGLVNRVVIGEKDPLVASFWKTVFEEPEWLIREVKKMKPSVAEWERYKAYRPRTDRTRALKCLFLNRTSFSGILSDTAGPIGGYAQRSPYGIDCRFYKKTITKRIRQAASLADRIVFVNAGDWEDTIQRVRNLGYASHEVLYYFDPPFYEKADRLYRYFFQDDDHRRLCDCLSNMEEWFLLSYDAAEPIATLYQGNGHAFDHVDMLYSTSSKGDLVKAKELIVTNLATSPQKTRLWRTMQT